jgi:hypothetical protein
MKSWIESKPQAKTLVKARYISAVLRAEYGVIVSVPQVVAICQQEQLISEAGGFRKNGLPARNVCETAESLLKVVNENNDGRIEELNVYQVLAYRDAYDRVQRDLNNYAEAS